MSDANLRDHLTIVAQLPDYVLGKLDETSLRRVARHLDLCPICRREADHAMDVVGVLADVPPPAADVRGAILRRVAAANAATEQVSRSAEEGRGEVRGTRPTDPRPAARNEQRQSTPFGQPVPNWALVAASAAIFLVMVVAGWRYEERFTQAPDGRISELVDDPAMAYPLDDSDLPVQAAGVVFAEPNGREVYLVANGLPVLPGDQRYQVWLFTTGNTQESAGLLPAAADGDLEAVLQTPGPFASYVGIGLTAEPQAGSVAPTSDLVLGGSFPPISAMVRSPQS